jgi:hypothetical protein
MLIFHAYLGGFSCMNAYIYKGLLGHKNAVPSGHLPPYSAVVKNGGAVSPVPSIYIHGMVLD